MSSVPTTSFALDPSIDVAALREAYACTGRVKIAPFLFGDGARRLRDHLLQRDDWRLALKTEPREFELDKAAREALGTEKLAGLKSLAAPKGRTGFTYVYDRIIAQVNEGRLEEAETLLAEFASFLSDEPVLTLLRSITGSEEIDFLDSQATRYGQGDFLTLHHDKKKGSRRIAAYVFGLTQFWRPEWGGLLLFHELASDVSHGLVPGFNMLNLFSVPQGHSVSQVGAFVPEPRLSITGWLRPFEQRVLQAQTSAGVQG